ncbi:Iq domain-containing protein k-like [Plakobranchus ocellatus]|uniref:Iq domain-containing protein k-like n=1 Tax=Plakobranchus ocellatus TaxID=259542 RepID=A0AAV4D5R4_9GAST|nr:Iq domain-containing protein k-like [Plakobranchus ocellatus]
MAAVHSSMSVITKVSEPNLWESICKEFSSQRPPFEEDDSASVTTDYSDYDPSYHHPVFYGRMFVDVNNIDGDATADFDAAISHPSCLGYSFTNKPPASIPPPPPAPPNRLTCTPTQYLNAYIYPTLLPAMEAMLKQAKLEKCFERRRTKFNACDYITEYLYKNNPNPQDGDRSRVNLWDIPFVKDWLKNHPRPPLPKSLIWTDEEAALIIQSFWRGYLVRKEPDVQELRVWQREWREENRGIQSRVSEFWDKQMPDGDDVAGTSESSVP